MKKISFAIFTSLLQLLTASAQTDSAAYKQRRLTLDQVNLVSSYYMQDGNNSAVTGGIGSEQLTDIANTIELRMIKRDKQDHLHSFSFELGIDHYTSASSDKIDASTISSASRADTRLYPSLNWTVSNDRNGLTAGAGVYYSTEYDYQSIGIDANVAKSSDDKNRELALKLQAYFDTWKVILPAELRPRGYGSGSDDGSVDSKPRNSYSASASFSQVINQRLQIALLADGIYQNGLLATKYQRVYFTDNSAKVENLPNTRFKLPLGIRVHYFIGTRVIARGYYRFYTDNWGVQAHTANIELPVKITPTFSVSPFYRYYMQTAANYFLPYHMHNASEVFYTSDYDLSKFQSHFFGIGLRLVPEKGMLGIRRWTSLELRYGHYLRNTGLHSDIISLNAGFR